MKQPKRTDAERLKRLDAAFAPPTPVTEPEPSDENPVATLADVDPADAMELIEADPGLSVAMLMARAIMHVALNEPRILQRDAVQRFMATPVSPDNLDLLCNDVDESELDTYDDGSISEGVATGDEDAVLLVMRIALACAAKGLQGIMFVSLAKVLMQRTGNQDRMEAVGRELDLALGFVSEALDLVDRLPKGSLRVARAARKMIANPLSTTR